MGAIALALSSSVACGQVAPRTTPPSPRLPGEAKSRARRTPPPPSFFWEPVDPDVRSPNRKALELPVAETAVTRVEGATRLWDDLPIEARDRLRRDGVLVLSDFAVSSPAAPAAVAPATPTSSSPSDNLSHPGRGSMGAFYMDLREQRIPHLITLDSLFALVHLGLERALSEVEDLALAPAIHSLLEKLDLRLRKEEVGVGTELAEGYRIARGVIAVARALEASPASSSTGSANAGAAGAGAAAGPAPYVPPGDVAAIVTEEKTRIEGRAAVAMSTLLGVPIDYSRFAVPSAAARPGAFRALAWLGAAPLSLVGRNEAPGAIVDVAQARANTRAAMVLARLCDRDVDPEINASYTHTTRLLAFVWGASDDLTLTEIDDLAEQSGIDLRKPENISNVTRVDKLRARARTNGRTPKVYDGSGGAFRGGQSARVFGGHAPIDSLALQGLVGAPVGLALDTAASATVDRLRNGRRVLPSTLDVMAFLGAPEARAALHETHADAFDGYDAALANVQQGRPSEQSVALHASIHGSLIDALLAWANSTDAPIVKSTPAADRQRVESMLSAWTLVRHAGQVLARPKPSAAVLSTELRVSGGPLPVFVEPMPEVIARLVAVVRQTRRGLEALAPLAPSSNATTMLVEIEDILRVALKGAEHHASDEPLSTEETSALASIPARLSRLEEAAPEHVGPVVAVVYSDPTTHRVLVSATGRIEPLLTFAREPSKDEPVLVVGAHVAHHELVDGSETSTSQSGSVTGVMHAIRAPLSDASWRARLKKAGAMSSSFSSFSSSSPPAPAAATGTAPGAATPSPATPSPATPSPATTTPSPIAPAPPTAAIGPGAAPAHAPWTSTFRWSAGTPKTPAATP